MSTLSAKAEKHLRSPRPDGFIAPNFTTIPQKKASVHQTKAFDCLKVYSRDKLIQDTEEGIEGFSGVAGAVYIADVAGWYRDQSRIPRKASRDFPVLPALYT